jgi:N-acetylmuramoyl-L-alanine amidase
MIRVAIQAGHEGRISGATGAPGEAIINVAVRNRLSQILIDKGFQLFLFNADPPQSQLNQDFDLFLALHCDANIYGTGGGVIACIAPPPIDSSESSHAESRRLRDVIGEEYFKHSEIVEHKERVNKNMTQYYMWAKLSAATHCVILEMGVAQDAHDKVLLADTERIATAIARGICKAYGVTYDVIPETPTQPDTTNQQLELANAEIKRLNLALSNQKNEYETKLAQLQQNCSDYRLSDKKQLKDVIIKFIGEQ